MDILPPTEDVIVESRRRRVCEGWIGTAEEIEEVGKGTPSESNVVRLPRDWLGPREGS